MQEQKHGKYQYLSEKEMQKIVKLRNQENLPIKTLSLRFNVSQAAIRNTLKKFNAI